MKRTSRRDPDYKFGQAMLTLRSAMGFTQAGLAKLLGISRYALGDWEAGENYPKVEHLKNFIILAVRQKAFLAGHEAEEIRTLWKSAHQKVLLDEHWLTELLTSISIPSQKPNEGRPVSGDRGRVPDFPPQPVQEEHRNNQPPALPPVFFMPQPMMKDNRLSSSPAPVVQSPRLDWGGALAVPNFYGRDRELRLLTQWLVEESCRVINIVGMGGIGKSALAVSEMSQVASQFEFVIWRSLRDAPTCETLLNDCLQALTLQAFPQTPAHLEQHIDLLLDYLRNHRVLLVLDNLETLMDEGVNVGYMRPGYEGYGRMLRQIAETNHQSCLLLTSREKVAELVSLEGSRTPVRTLRLTQLDGDACERLLLEKDIIGSSTEKGDLIQAYAGNPLALKIVAQTIAELFGGEITPFLDQGEVIFGGVRRLLNEQFTRLSRLEQDVIVWLAILREPSTLNELRAVLVRPTKSAALLEAIESLSRRSLIEHGQTRGSFTLQSVVQEYVTARLIATASEEIERGQLDRLVKNGLELAHAREYVRQIQVRLIVTPLLERLRSIYSPQARLEEYLLALIQEMSARPEVEQGYGPANLVVLLRLLCGNLRGVDLSRLVLRNLYLQDVAMQDARLVNTVIQDSVFTEAFDALTGVAISPTGEYWAASSRRGEIRIWEAEGQTLRHMWRGHIGTIWALAFSPDGQLLASGSNDGSLKLWDVDSGKLRWSNKDANDVNRLSFSPDGRVLAGAVNNSRIYLWDAATGTLLQSLPQPGSVAAVVWSPDGTLLASGDVKGDIELWALKPMESARHLQTLKGHTNCADGLAFAPDSRSLASASWDGTVKLWESVSGRLLQTLTGHNDRVGRVAWSPDGTTIASGSADQTILLWNLEQGRYQAALKGHGSHIYEIAFTPDGQSLLSSSRDGCLRVWNVVSEQCIRVIHGYAASIYDVDWSPDSRRLVSGGTDLVVNVWDIRAEAPLQVLHEHTGVVRAVGWSPNGRWLASSDTEYGIRLWDLTSGENFRFLRHPDNNGNYIYGLAWSPDGHRLASGTHQHGVMIWDVMTRTETRLGRELSTWFPQVAWSPDGTRLAGAGVDGSTYIWNVTDDMLEQQLAGHQSRISCLAWSPDGTRLATGASGGEGGELFVWDLQRGQRSKSLVGHINVVSAVAWESGGTRLISGGGQGLLRWWDVETGELLWIREVHDGAIQGLRRSPDGTRLASCGDDGAIMLWDISSGEHLQTLRRDRPYERLDITGIRGLTEAQKEMLRSLGAIEDETV